jgi:hypothetical protein
MVDVAIGQLGRSWPFSLPEPEAGSGGRLRRILPPLFTGGSEASIDAAWWKISYKAMATLRFMLCFPPWPYHAA